jgi:hypothetical protein
MGWLTDSVKSTGISGDVLKTVEAVDKGAGEVLKTVREGVVAEAATATISAIVLPTKVAISFSQDDLKEVEATVKEIVREIDEVADSAGRVASSPYLLAADITRDVGADGAKLFRGYINNELVTQNVIPIILDKLGKLDTNPADVDAVIKAAPTSVLLASYLTAAHSVLAPLAQPVPNSIKKLLKEFYPAEILDNAKYIVSKFGLILPEAINGTQAFMGNHTFAVTVDDVVVFSIEPDNSDNAIHWWAHEIQHVVQCAQLGIDRFSENYIHDYNGMESNAEEKSGEVTRSLT